MTRGPVLLTVPPMTVSSTLLVAGLLSPVTMDSSTCERPSITFPSAGIFAPATTCAILSSQFNRKFAGQSVLLMRVPAGLVVPHFLLH